MGTEGDRGPGSSGRTITVTATGEAASRPDALSLSFGVSANARTATEALARASTSTTALLIVLEQAGIADADVQTANLGVTPIHDYEHQTPGRPPQLTGYQAVNRLAVLVRGLDRVGPLIDAAAAAVGDGFEMYDAGFSVLDEVDQQAIARRDALAKAWDRARQLAAGAGGELGDVLAIAEGPWDGGRFGPVINARLLSTAPMPIQPGTETIRVTLTVTYELR